MLYLFETTIIYIFKKSDAKWALLKFSQYWLSLSLNLDINRDKDQGLQMPLETE